MFQSINPQDGSVIGNYSPETNEAIHEKLLKAGNAYRSWKNLSVEQRVKYLNPVKQSLLTNLDQHAQLIHLEMGKLISEAQMEVRKCTTLIDTYAANATHWLANEKLESNGVEHFAQYEPLGSILGIMPWNYPYWQVMRFAIPTLVAGNTVIIKHAPNVFGCSKKIEEIFTELLPEGVYQNIIIDHSQVEQLVSSNIIQGVSLTGSDRAGREVMQLAGKYLKKVVLELGGSDPFIVFADANLKKAIRHATTGRLLTSGQTCIAAKRFFIESEVYEEFYQGLIESFNKNQIAPLVNLKAKENAQALIEDAKAKGANIYQSNHTGEGAFFPPTIVTGIKSNMLLAHKEVFAPIACLYKFDSDEEVIKLANDTQYGLGAAVFSSNRERALNISKEIECGNIFINSFTKSDAMISFGGVKSSGIGRELGKLGIREFTNYKTYNIYR